MIKNVVFDLGNVLLHFDAMALARRYTETEADAKLIYTEVLRSIEWVLLDRGSISLDEAFSRMASRLPARLCRVPKELFLGWTMTDDCDPEAVALLKELKENGYKLYLLSTTNESFHSFWPHMSAAPYFDGFVVSCDIHILKPEAGIYEELFRRFSLIPEECFFVDDLPPNIEAGLRAGMKGCVYHGDVGRLRLELRDAGVVI